MGNNKKKNKKKELPFVSICTPTFNRRPFIPFAIKCFNHQDQLTLTEFALKVGPVVQSWMGKWACIVFCLLN